MHENNCRCQDSMPTNHETRLKERSLQAQNLLNLLLFCALLANKIAKVNSVCTSILPPPHSLRKLYPSFLLISLVLGEVFLHLRGVGKVVIAVTFKCTCISIREMKTIIRKNTNRSRISSRNSAKILRLTSLVIEHTAPTGLLLVG